MLSTLTRSLKRAVDTKTVPSQLDVLSTYQKWSPSRLFSTRNINIITSATYMQ